MVWDDLPLLLGPQGQAREIMEQYRHAAQMLLPAGLKAMEFRLDQRNAWYLKVAAAGTGEQLEIEVGQGDITAKLKRFLVVYQAVLQHRQEEIEHIDIRYSNGVAVRWRKDQAATVNRQAMARQIISKQAISKQTIGVQTPQKYQFGGDAKHG